MRSFLAALSFLTILPSLRPADVSPQAISNSRAWFPLVGLLIGLVLVGLEWALAYVFSPYVTAALLVVALVAMTRALHLDGLMDTCDGLFGGHSPERRREIMRDSHVGAFAVAGAVGIMLLKYGALVSLLTFDGVGAEVGSGFGKEWALLLFPTISRYAMVLQIMVFPYVRAPGLGTSFHQNDSRLPSLMAAITAALASLALGGIGGLLLLAGAGLVALLLGRGIAALIGGMTGDTYGATNEITETLVLLGSLAIMPLGILAPVNTLLPAIGGI